MRMPARLSSAAVGAALLCAAGAAPAAVQPQPGEIIVQNVRPSTGEEEWVPIRYTDLAIGTPAGQRSLLQRVSFAIESLCGGVNLADPTYSLKCSNQAQSSVQPQLARLLR